MTKIKTEDDLRDFISKNGFAVNHRKSKQEEGYDIVAIKDGFSFLIEHKIASIRENGSYRIDGEIKGDICAVSTEEGNLFFIVNEKTSLTKTARFIDMVN